jgi:hypothetical protein
MEYVQQVKNINARIKPVNIFWSKLTHTYCKVDRFKCNNNFAFIDETHQITKKCINLQPNFFIRLTPGVSPI